MKKTILLLSVIAIVLLQFSAAFAHSAFGNINCDSLNRFDNLINSADYSFTGHSLQTTIQYPPVSDQTTAQNTITCNRFSDSLFLIDVFYPSLNGPSWTGITGWGLNPALPINAWTGISLSNSGCVEIIDLFGKNLSGAIPPSIDTLTGLKELLLSNNMISGQIPPELGNLPDLFRIWLGRNNLSGEIPPELANATSLLVIFLDNNKLTGSVPTSFQTLSLTQLEIHNNCIDFLPDLSMLPVANNGKKFKVQNNKLTFDDILPNLGPGMDTFYQPQDSVGPDTMITVVAGTNFSYDLGIDSGIVDNNYMWTKDGLFHSTVIGDNRLQFDDIGFADAGTYKCTITNPNAPLLTLYTRCITIKIICGPETVDIDTTICPEDSIIINGTTFGNTTGVFSAGFTFPSANRHGCDSILNISVSLYDSAKYIIDTTLCAGDSIVVNNTTYDESNSTGIERLPGAGQHGCDSFIFVNVYFHPEVIDTISSELCSGQSIIVNGKTYDETNPVGTEVIPGGASTGCDSTIVVNLQFSDTYQDTITASICQGACYPQGNNCYSTTGTHIDTFASINNCDSIVVLFLTVNDKFEVFLQEEICAGTCYAVGTNCYDATGVYRDTFLSANNCDSIVELTLTVRDTFRTIRNESICAGDTFFFHNTPRTSTGTYIDTLQSIYNCDSIVVLNLNVLDTFHTIISEAICLGESYTFGTNTVNTAGTYFDTLSAASGCDSFVTLHLTVNDTFLTALQETICDGDSFFFNGRARSVAGTYRDTLMTTAGCDSFIELQLNVLQTYQVNIDTAICDGMTLEILNKTYASTGVYYDTLQASNGCDSVFIIDLTVKENPDTILNISICQGQQYIFGDDSIQITGTYFDTFPAANGCDSTITLNLLILDTLQTVLNESICEGDIYPFNNTNLSMAGTYRDTFTAINGCDSFVILHLAIKDTFETVLNESICQGEFYSFNGKNETATGTYRDTLTAINGCDSFLILHLTVLDTYQTVLNDSICQGEAYLFNNMNLSVTGTYRDTFPAANGCDSFIVLHLTVLDTFYTSENIEMCDGDTMHFFGQIIQETGIYSVTIPASNGCDSTIVKNVTVYDAATLGPADAGADFHECLAETTLSANLPPNTSGKWTSDNGQNFENDSGPQTTVFNLQPGENYFTWTLSTTLCADYDAATVIVFREDTPNAFPDSELLPYDVLVTDIYVSQNDDLTNVSGWFTEITEAPDVGTVSPNPDGSFAYTVPAIKPEFTAFYYRICNDLCPTLCDTAIARILFLEKPPDTLSIPSGITPNDDGINDVFYIDGLEEYPDNDLVIFNRWGDRVFHASPYQNNWDGTDQRSGKELPQGTYYYILRLDVEEGEIYKGYVVVLR